MMYRAVVYFTDLQDNGHAYDVGDIFPREGVEVSAERLEELSSSKNKRGKALIELVKEKASKAADETASEPVEAEDEAEKPKKKSKKSK